MLTRVTKKKLNVNGIDDSNINYSKSHICSSFEPFENIISGIQLYKKSIIRSLIIFKKLSRMTNDSLSNSIFIHTFWWTSSDFFSVSDFLEKVSKPTKTSKKDHSFHNIVLLKKPQPIWHWKNMLPQCSQKPFQLFPTFPNFTASIWLVPEKHLHWTTSRCWTTAFLKHSESKCLYISVYLCIKIFVPEICWGAGGGVLVGETE